MSKLFIALVCAAAASGGPATVRVFDANGNLTAETEAWALSAGRVFSSRSSLRGAKRAEVLVDGGLRGVTAVLADDEDIDIAELQLDPEGGIAPLPVTPEAVARWRMRDVPGIGDVFTPGPELRANGRSLIDSEGRLAGIIVGDAAIPLTRLYELRTRAPLSLMAWNASIRTAPELEKRYRDGLALLERGETGAARNVFDEITKRDEHHAHSWFQLGFIRGKMGQSAQKIAAFEKAISEQPDFANAYFSLAFAYMLSGKRDAARDVYLRLRAVDPQAAERIAVLVDADEVDPAAPAEKPKPPALPSEIV